MSQSNNQSWINEFENRFSINKIERNYWRVIVGQEPYKQCLGSIPLCSKGPLFYQVNGLGDVAFLVNDFIKIQDSLEMTFNLLCYDPIKSIEMIAFLKSKPVSSSKFADYLVNNHKIILINKHYFNQNLFKVIGYNASNKFLFIGQKAGKLYNSTNITNNEKGVIIHPSGVNLNIGKIKTVSGGYDRNEIYYESWYKQNNNYLLKKYTNFNLRDFSIR